MYLWFFWQTQTLAAFSSAILCFKFLALFENCLNLENVLSNCLAVSTLVHFWLSVYIRDIYLRNKSFMLGKYGSKWDEPDRAICHLLQCHESRIHIFTILSTLSFLTFETFSLSIVTCRSELVVPLMKCLTRYLARPINFPNSDKSPIVRILCGFLYI